MVHSGAGLEVEVVGRVYLRRDVFERRVSGGVYFELRIWRAGEFCLVSRGSFFTFRAIFHLFGQFWSIFRVDFSFFRFFRSPRDGILAPRMAP
jgi:hypothetical protein